MTHWRWTTPRSADVVVARVKEQPTLGELVDWRLGLPSEGYANPAESVQQEVASLGRSPDLEEGPRLGRGHLELLIGDERSHGGVIMPSLGSQPFFAAPGRRRRFSVGDSPETYAVDSV